MVLGKLAVPGRSTIWITVGPCACSRCGFSLYLGDGPIWTEILCQRAVKPKTTNQPILISGLVVLGLTAL